MGEVVAFRSRAALDLAVMRRAFMKAQVDYSAAHVTEAMDLAVLQQPSSGLYQLQRAFVTLLSQRADEKKWDEPIWSLCQELQALSGAQWEHLLLRIRAYPEQRPDVSIRTDWQLESAWERWLTWHRQCR